MSSRAEAQGGSNEAELDNPSREDFEDRTLRAVEQSMVVVQVAPGMCHVYSQDGTQYTVDIYLEACGCDDMFYREPEGGCKHVRRAKLKHGEMDLEPLIRCPNIDISHPMFEHLAVPEYR